MPTSSVVHRSLTHDVLWTVSFGRFRDQKGVRDYLSNRLFSFPDNRVERYFSQLCVLLIETDDATDGLEYYLWDVCSHSLRMAAKVYWLLTAALEDNPKRKKLISLCEKCRNAAINGNWSTVWKGKYPSARVGFPNCRPLARGHSQRWTSMHGLSLRATCNVAKLAGVARDAAVGSARAKMKKLAMRLGKLLSPSLTPPANSSHAPTIGICYSPNTTFVMLAYCVDN